MSRLWRGAMPLLFILSLAVPAGAANFTVNPMQVSLSPSVRSGVVTSDEELRFQISAFEWDQDDHGGIKLSSTSSLIVFPQLLTLPPGGQRQIRIGTDTTAAGNELSYRVFFEELPASKATAGNGVQMRTRIGLPVFVRPPGALTAAIQIRDLRAVEGKIAVEARNTGKAHTTVDSVKIVGLDATGKSIYTKDVAGWSVLPNRSTIYEVDVAGAGCSAVSFSASVLVGGKAITDQWSGTVPGCK